MYSIVIRYCNPYTDRYIGISSIFILDMVRGRDVLAPIPRAGRC